VAKPPDVAKFLNERVSTTPSPVYDLDVLAKAVRIFVSGAALFAAKVGKAVHEQKRWLNDSYPQVERIHFTVLQEPT